ncbi:hypothetical protein ASG01_12630 [Chryseobacterium sp. Leaf180]|uniref:glycosyltransferase family 2 protein n=1 Tax=Chryseobacterium sp. Leaf180 TaxID=1736289 RepID=UPI0006FF17B8|nr:glycosyltransferase family 2 protein [Chryseobacterium sp. Leaf180]KQR91845.1 hypothetical protein ASG01_12630 [Chryseobacterium sp. Leaf180]
MITIAIPFYNASPFLDLAIQSVFNQTYKDWKLLLIDDGSTDGSLEIAVKYQNDSRVIIHTDGENRNLGYRLNQIPTLVTTKYLARMDADDIMHPEKIQKQLLILESNPHIDVLGTNAYSIDEEGWVQGIRLSYNSQKVLNKVDSFIHPTIIAKTSWFLANPYDVRAVRLEDAELWYRTRNIYNFQVLAEPLFFYREFGKDYYKKYFKGFGPIVYILKKHMYNINIIKFFVKYYLSGFIYFLFSLVNNEKFLINRRNATRISKLTIDEILQR